MKKHFIPLLLLVLALYCFSFSEAQNPAVKAFEKNILKAHLLPLNKVRLLGGPLKQAQDVTRSDPPRFFDVEYAIDAHIIKGKKKVTVRFEATEENSIATVFGIRMIRREKDR